jgi:hypothetical protein
MFAPVASRPALSTAITAAAFGLFAAACGGDAQPAQEGEILQAVSPVALTATSTAVARREPSSTPTPLPDPMSPVNSRHVPGVVVPFSAQLTLMDADQGAEPEAGTDLLVEYLIPEGDADTLRAWFREHMAAGGWDEGEDRDGALMFRHTTEHSLRGDEDEPMRTVTIFFGLSDGATISILAEAPAR